MGFLKLLLQMYVSAFKHGLSRQLLLIIALKLFIMFAILKMFFFKDYLKEKFQDNDSKKSEYVIDNLTNINNKTTIYNN